MQARRRAAIAAALLCVASLTAVMLGADSADPLHLRPPDANARSRTDEVAERDVQISVWKKALEADSESAIALGQLAGLYMQRGRETGDETNYNEAEQLARRSLTLRSRRNGAAFATLATSMLAQHRFVEADSVVTRLVSLEPDIPEYRALQGEIKLEIGDYDAARIAFESVQPQRSHLSVAPRFARWLEINGHSIAARDVMRKSLSEARQRRDLPREQLAWFYLRLGDMEQRTGRTRVARSFYEQGLAAHPGDHRLLAATARLEAVEEQPQKAIDYGERAMAVKLDPATLGVIGDAYAAIGDSARAEDYFRTMEVSVAGQPGAYHRAWSLFLLDQDRRVSEVLANVTSELETRKDIYGYDLLAWALHKSGRGAEAREAMKQALRMKTEDAMLLFHAGVIEHSLGNRTLARRFLGKALALNPKFHPTQPAQARALLKSMGS